MERVIQSINKKKKSRKLMKKLRILMVTKSRGKSNHRKLRKKKNAKLKMMNMKKNLKKVTIDNCS